MRAYFFGLLTGTILDPPYPAFMITAYQVLPTWP